MTDLDTLLRQLPDDVRPDALVNADLEAAIEGAISEIIEAGGTPWAYDYQAWILTARFLRHFPDQQRRAFEIHAWRLGYVLGLDAARCPAPVQLDLSKPLSPRETVLVWCHFMFGDEPWSTADLQPLRSITMPETDPIGRALWRLATRSGLDHLRRDHRELVADACRERLGFARLVVEEAREIVRQQEDVDALRLVIELLHDPILNHRDLDGGLSLLGLATLYRASAHQRLYQLDPAMDCLGHWRGLDSNARIPHEQRILAAEIKARIEMDEDQLVVAGDRLARSVFSAADSVKLSKERRVEIFTTLGEHLKLSRLHADAVGMFTTALHWLRADPTACRGAQHVEVVGRLASARWSHFLNDLRQPLFASDPMVDTVFEVIRRHRESFEAMRSDLDRVAADWFKNGKGLDDAVSLLEYRWFIARSRVLDDPHAAVAGLAAVGPALAQHWPRFALGAVARDLLFALRLAGWRLDQVIDAEPLAALYEIEPDTRRVVEEIVYQLPADASLMPTASSIPDLDRATVH